jgi:hypothetical protein
MNRNKRRSIIRKVKLTKRKTVLIRKRAASHKYNIKAVRQWIGCVPFLIEQGLENIRGQQPVDPSYCNLASSHAKQMGTI